MTTNNGLEFTSRIALVARSTLPRFLKPKANPPTSRSKFAQHSRESFGLLAFLEQLWRNQSNSPELRIDGCSSLWLGFQIRLSCFAHPLQTNLLQFATEHQPSASFQEKSNNSSRSQVVIACTSASQLLRLVPWCVQVELDVNDRACTFFDQFCYHPSKSKFNSN